MSHVKITQGIHALVMAAGGGTRFGGGKLTADYRARPLILGAVEAALASEAELVTVVLGAGAARMEELLRPLAGQRLRMVTCANWQEGLSASLRCGVESLPQSSDALLIFLGDMPDVPHRISARLLAEIAGGAPAARPVYKGRSGHPVALSARLLPGIADLTGDCGARMLLAGVEGVVRIETDDHGCIRDIDTQADLTLLSAEAD